LQPAANTNVAEIVLRKSVGFLYTKRTQFSGKAEGGRLNAKGKAIDRFGDLRQIGTLFRG
jgi:hypothetical protein